jgi:hypothetical protein
VDGTYLTRGQVARQAGLSVSTVDRMRERGELPWVPFGERLVRFRPQIVADLAAARERLGNDEAGSSGASGAPRRRPSTNGNRSKPERELAPLRPLPRKGGKRFLPPALEQARADKPKREQGRTD